MRHLLWIGALLGLASGLARGAPSSAEVCVQNFLAGGSDPCAMGLPNFAYIVKKSAPDRLVCVRTYVDERCKFAAASFDHVLKPDGERICTINYHQPPFAAMCASDPERYVWVDAAYPDDEP